VKQGALAGDLRKLWVLFEDGGEFVHDLRSFPVGWAGYGVMWRE